MTAPADDKVGGLTAFAEPLPPPWQGRRNSVWWTIYVACPLILLATALAYGPVYFNFFNGDDFVHLTWLKDAVKNPELIWRNFHSAWLDGTTARFYRPLISVFMVSDYLIWGVNGLGFRLTNLACHALSTIFLCLIVSRISQPERTGSRERATGNLTWAMAAAALFALYPLHPEAVSWITGRVDSVVTVFYLACLWFYMQWRSVGGFIWLAAAGLSMALGLASKEMAVTLPLTFLAYELFLGKRSGHGRALDVAPAAQDVLGSGAQRCASRAARRISASAAKVYLAARPTLPFWALLAAYFGLRRLALGTLVGGYDDSLFFIADWKTFLFNWAHGLRMMLVPINKDLLGAHHLLTKSWEVSLGMCCALGLWTVLVERSWLRPAAFLAAWFVLTLIPVYKVFAIADDLQGSRLAYLATVPLCALIAVAFAGPTQNRPWSSLRSISMAALALGMSILAGILLWSNNQAWASAGRESNAIRAALNELYQRLPGDPQVLLVGLPDNIHGAYTCRNALWGMTKQPQLSRDIKNCLMVDSFEQILPFGFLKSSLAQSRGQVLIFRWAGVRSGFVPVSLDKTTDEPGQGRRLRKALLEPQPKADCHYLWRQDGQLEVRGGKGFRGRPELLIDTPGLPCWTVDFIRVEVVLLEPEVYKSTCGADILYANDLMPDFQLARRAHADVERTAREQQLIFPLRSRPDWALGGRCRGLKLLLPDASHILVKSIEIVPASEVMPAVSFTNSGYLGTKGFIHLSRDKGEQEISIDATSLPAASGCILEITRPNLFFETQNSRQESSLVMKVVKLASRQGKISIRRDFFPKEGLYEARGWAIDAGAKKLGVAGDHFVVSVDR